MKIIAILLLLLGSALIVGLGFMYLFLFAMSFDAPGSADDPKAWGMRLLFLLPVIGLIVALIFAFLAFQSGNYVRAVRIGSVFVIALLGLLAVIVKSQMDNVRYVREMREQELEDAKYPMQKFVRPVDKGADTILVFPSRIVAYRIFDENNSIPIGGPVGQLNKTRDTIKLDNFPENHLKREDFEFFLDESGKKFSEAFQFH
ncbi:MAG: hypothetical protein ACKV1O_00620 [Saprospiraceae bacterium]